MISTKFQKIFSSFKFNSIIRSRSQVVGEASLIVNPLIEYYNIVIAGNLNNLYVTGRTLKSSVTGDDVFEEPVKYSMSKAASHESHTSFMNEQVKNPAPVYQQFSISLSILAFLVYFAFLRSESDVDDLLTSNLYEYVPAIEEAQLMILREQLVTDGKSTVKVDQRLHEIQQE